MDAPNTEATLDSFPPPIALADLDIRRSAATLGAREARYLVDLYYNMQEYRKASGNQVRALDESQEPHVMISWSMATFGTVEKSIKSALQSYAENQRPGDWALSIHGIGPVIAAGLLAHIDAKKAKTAGAVWRFAGLDPTVKWEKGKKRPWNADLKRLSWIISDSFVKHRASPKDFYGKIYDARKQLEVARNEAGRFSDTAARTLTERKFKDKKTEKIYESGKLPDGRIDLRARRYAVKIFLAHYHHVAYECEFNEPPPMPYSIAIQGHGHYIGPPNWKR